MHHLHHLLFWLGCPEKRGQSMYGLENILNLHAVATGKNSQYIKQYLHVTSCCKSFTSQVLLISQRQTGQHTCSHAAWYQALASLGSFFFFSPLLFSYDLLNLDFTLIISFSYAYFSHQSFQKTNPLLLSHLEDNLHLIFSCDLYTSRPI